jgi:hypothetical protein
MSDLPPDFELFTGRSMRPIHEPTVTVLGKRGRITMNNASYELLGQPEHVELLFDRKNDRMALRKANKSDHTYPVQKAQSANSFTIAARAFFAYYQLGAGSRRYVPQSNGKILIVDLNGPFDNVERSVTVDGGMNESETEEHVG